MSSEQDCRGRSRRRKPLHPLNSLQGSLNQSEDAGILSDGESPAAKRVRREPDSSSDCIESLPLLPVPQTPEEAAAASREQAEEAAEYLNFLSSLPHISKVAKRSRRPLLPPPRPDVDGRLRKTLVLDLDHTLIRSTLFNPHMPAKSSREVFVTGDGARTAFERRPHLAHFLESVSTLFEIAVFTAGSQSYAGPLLDILDPHRTVFEHRLFRDSCLRVPSHSQPGLAFLMKDMSALGRDLAHTVIVDNTPTVFGYQLNNGIPIASWYEDAADCELLHLLPFLAKLATAPDVRPLVAQRFPLHRMVHSAMSKFPAAFPCAQPAPGLEARLPPLPPPQPAAPADTASLGLLADACLGLACDEDLGNSPFEALDDDDDSAVQQPVQAVVTPGPDQDLAPVERMAAEADAALSRMSAAVTGGSDLVLVGCSAAHLEPESSTASEAAAAAVLPDTCDAESMWAAEAIAEADMLSSLEGAGSPVEAVAQLSLPMFPEAVTPPDTPVRGSHPPAPFAPGCATDPSADDVPSESAADSSSSQQLEQLASLIRRSSSEGMPGQRQVISGFEADLASNPAQLQRPCQRDVDSSFADKGRLREAASAPPTLDLADYLLDKGPCFQSSGAGNLKSAGRLPGGQGLLHRLPSARASLDLDALGELFAPSLIGSILSASSADSSAEAQGSMCGPKEVQSPQIACA